MPERKRIYLAGPEVFLPDAAAVGAEKCRLCAEAGFEGVFPLDTALDLSGLSRLEQARRISLSNENLMQGCDLLIANLTPFRGVSMDSGTAFEVGYMRALGRPVLGYTNVGADLAERAQAYRAGPRAAGDCDRPACEVESFGLAENLMIEIAIRECGFEVVRSAAPDERPMAALDGFRRCLELARRALDSGR
jgi:nucleoside 2-deoxyribosyltransferase